MSKFSVLHSLVFVFRGFLGSFSAAGRLARRGEQFSALAKAQHNEKQEHRSHGIPRVFEFQRVDSVKVFLLYRCNSEIKNLIRTSSPPSLWFERSPGESGWAFYLRKDSARGASSKFRGCHGGRSGSSKRVDRKYPF